MLINGLGIGVPYGTSGGGSGGSGSILATSSLYLPLKTTIVPTRGASTPTFTRATAAWDFDSEGKLNLNIPSGCPRFTGARLVRNLCPQSEVFNTGAWGTTNLTAGANSFTTNATVGDQVAFLNAPPTTVIGYKYTYSTRVSYNNHRYVQLTCSSAGFGSGQHVNFDLNDGTYTATGCTAEATLVSTGVYDLQATFTATAAAAAGPVLVFANDKTSSRVPAFAGGTGKIIGVLRAQFENVTGQADQTASEYVSVGVLSAPFHGAGVDGCKYFTTNKNDTPIYSSVLKKYLAEPSRVNNCLWGRDATNAAWTKSNVTAAKTATGIDNIANSASRLTAAANDATLLQLLTAATGSRTTSAWIKRISGSGTVSLTRNGGTNWTDITSSLVTDTWVPVEVTSDVGANPTVGLKMGTSGDVIEVDCFQDENGAWRASPILTTTAAVTRNADVLSYASAFDVTQGTALCSVQSSVPITVSGYVVLAGDANARMLRFDTSTARDSGELWDATNTATATGLPLLTGARKRASRWGSDLRMCADGTLGSATAFDGSMGAATTMYVGCSQTGASQISGNLGEVHIWNSALTDAQLQQVTT